MITNTSVNVACGHSNCMDKGWFKGKKRKSFQARMRLVPLTQKLECRRLWLSVGRPTSNKGKGGGGRRVKYCRVLKLMRTYPGGKPARDLVARYIHPLKNEKGGEWT
jgi:hypothetical protein